MNGGLVPLLLLSTTVGLMLAFLPVRAASLALAGFGVAALVTYAASFDFGPNLVFAGLWLSMVAAAVLVYLPVRRWSTAALPISLNAGFWLGACASLTGNVAALLIGVLPLFIVIPARMLTSGKFSIVLKVLASWMIAIASLSLFVSLIPTPGYKPDHME